MLLNIHLCLQEREKQKLMSIEEKGLQQKRLLMNRKAIEALGEAADDEAAKEAEEEQMASIGGTNRSRGKTQALKQDPALTLQVTRGKNYKILLMDRQSHSKLSVIHL